MRSILRNQTYSCNPDDWRLHATVDVSLQYARANSVKNVKISCISNSNKLCREMERFVRFSEQHLPNEPSSSVKNDSLELIQQNDSTNTASVPHLPSKFSTQDEVVKECQPGPSLLSIRKIQDLVHSPLSRLFTIWEGSLSQSKGLVFVNQLETTSWS